MEAGRQCTNAHKMYKAKRARQGTTVSKVQRQVRGHMNPGKAAG